MIRGKTIDGADIGNGTDIPDLEMDACSFLCLQDPECKFWQWKDTLCSLKTDEGTVSSSPTSFYGKSLDQRSLAELTLVSCFREQM